MWWAPQHASVATMLPGQFEQKATTARAIRAKLEVARLDMSTHKRARGIIFLKSHRCASRVFEVRGPVAVARRSNDLFIAGRQRCDPYKAPVAQVERSN